MPARLLRHLRRAVHKRNGAIESVRGDPAHFVSQGQLCTKCSIGYNNEWLDPRARLTRPLRRVGRKGEGRFEPVSWDDALAAIAGRLKRIVASAGPQAILNTHYSGTISLIAYLSRRASSTASARPRSAPTRFATWPATWPCTTCTELR